MSDVAGGQVLVNGEAKYMRPQELRVGGRVRVEGGDALVPELERVDALAPQALGSLMLIADEDGQEKRAGALRKLPMQKLHAALQRRGELTAVRDAAAANGGEIHPPQHTFRHRRHA